MDATDLKVQRDMDQSDAAVREHLRKMLARVGGHGVWLLVLDPLVDACNSGDFSKLEEHLPDEVARRVRRLVANAAMVTICRKLQAIKDDQQEESDDDA